MGLFEKRRFKNFLVWTQDFTEEDPKTWKDLSPTSTMDEVYKKFGLDENTSDFVGHALALHRDDSYRSGAHEIYKQAQYSIQISNAILDMSGLKLFKYGNN